jgi:hypothetical protein
MTGVSSPRSSTMGGTIDHHQHPTYRSPISMPLSTTTAQQTHQQQQKECDYDINPTILYQAIEAKQWEYAISLFTTTNNKRKTGSNAAADDEEEEELESSSTWVVRKETNGKLRWRILPLHAAVIFGAPISLIEVLILDYPYATQCKDDQGMLPLHLAFRNESNWDVIEELLTAYPAAVFISDRKGRTPLQCAIRYANSSSTTNNISSASSVISTATSTVGRPGSSNTNSVGMGSTTGSNHTKKSLSTTVVSSESHQDKSKNSSSSNNNTNIPNKKVAASPSFRSIVNVIDLYSQIALSGERNRITQEIQALANSSISQIKEKHLTTLSALKREWEIQQHDQTQQMKSLQAENQQLRRRVRELEQPLSSTPPSSVSSKTNNDNLDSSSVENAGTAPANNDEIIQHELMGTMITEQKVYHNNVQNLLLHYQNLITEREQIRSILLKNHNNSSASEDEDEEITFLNSFQLWYTEQGQKLKLLEEEKKVDDDNNNSSHVK